MVQDVCVAHEMKLSAQHQDCHLVFISLELHVVSVLKPLFDLMQVQLSSVIYLSMLI